MSIINRVYAVAPVMNEKNFRRVEIVRKKKVFWKT